MTILHSNVWRVFFLLSAAAFAGFAIKYPETASAQARAELIGDRVSLTDRAGIKRVSFGFSGGNQQFTYVWLADSRGVERVRLTISPDEDVPQITFFGRGGKALPNTRLGSSARANNSAFAHLKKGPTMTPRVTDDIALLQVQVKDLQKQINDIVAALQNSAQ